MKKNGSSIDDLESAAISELLKFFNGPSAVRESSKAINGARLALGSLSAIGRLKATSRVKDATQLDVIKNVAENKKEFQEFTANSLPHLMPKKLITSTPEK